MPPTDWKLLAQARGVSLSIDDLDRVSAVLAALESAFQPLLADLDYTTEPAFVLPDHPIDQIIAPRS